ncbi:protein-S-isoprenylcysteine O-methyltransferase Ste14 [Klebsiella oxytoca]|uniref:Protein-S-isoprenylcysteine O-methyltransferase Ste14 n=1 Tax=Klebsiella oxytoca TaxID=571 RepID=A0A318F6W8_KLEOX|nr:methyltransferase [Klebsiella oxytoca]PXW34864.1 protein-S-isoprenylcysteine O-methyltransferase Ste14 [Klebsiella oxytoca]HCB1502276.1 isoprenylcysteine carboxylmethyltransferase family protein [Klebsiella michiganensis]HCB1848603.1 isoprenylcysteine carboxylmethyltransferase family protein [Klebsiella oxytoca]
MLRKVFVPPVLLLLFVLFDLLIAGHEFWVWTPPSLSLAALLLGVCAVIVFGTLRQFRTHLTTLNPLRAQETTTLMTDGWFRYSRNPIYLAMIGVQVAFISLSGIPLLLLTLPLFIYLLTMLHIRPEEAELARLFPRQWPEYARKVRRWL